MPKTQILTLGILAVILLISFLSFLPAGEVRAGGRESFPILFVFEENPIAGRRFFTPSGQELASGANGWGPFAGEFPHWPKDSLY